jgi:hypothetical protein
VTALEAAGFYIGRGLHPIPIPSREKAPKLDNWLALRLTAAELPRYFNGAPSNIGVILGDEYGLADVDLDCPEAITVAEEFLPETAMVFGRKSAPASHRFYRCDPPVRSKRLQDPVNKQTIVELRCRKGDASTPGLQTVVPPSIHPSGEQIRFEPGCDGHPANVDAPRLQAAVARIAAAAVLVRHWPGEKSGRNEAFMALAGALARAGWAVDQTTSFHRAIYLGLWGAAADLGASKAEVVATYEKHGANQNVRGVPSLVSLIDKRAIDAAWAWLGIAQTAGVKPQIAAPRSVDLEDMMNDASIVLPEMAIEGLVPKCGLVLLGGRPKEGKSWLAAQVALSFITGQALGGWLRVLSPGRCHLWALEDGLAITKDKMKKLLAGSMPEASRDLRTFHELPKPLLAGGDQLIRAALAEHPAELVILDSLFKLAGHQQQKADISQRDYDVIDCVRRIALDHHCAAIIVMHTRKGANGGDPVENLMGTTGNTAAADAVCELKRNGYNAKLTIVGRIVPRTELEMLWHDGDTWGWTFEGETSKGRTLGETSEEVLAFLEAEGASKPSSIAKGLKATFGAVWQALLRLQAGQRVRKTAARKWELIR